MRAGTLTENISILKPNVTTNDVGEQTTEYIVKLTTKAKVEFDSGNREIENREIVYNYSKTFKTRYYIEVDEYDRIHWNNKQYRILSIEPNRQYQELTIKTELVNE
jgi:SPP1 family predicted phage head-tail adaptor